MYVQWLRLKDCRAVSTLTVLNPRSPEGILVAVFFVKDREITMRNLLILCCAIVFPALAYAQNAAPETTKIVTDQAKGTITFIIDGKPVAQINKDGLHVVESINYGGMVTDSSPANIKKIIEAGGKDAE